MEIHLGDRGGILQHDRRMDNSRCKGDKGQERVNIRDNGH